MNIFKKIKKEKNKRFEGVSDAQIRKDLDYLLRFLLDIIPVLASRNEAKMFSFIMMNFNKLERIYNTYGYQEKVKKVITELDLGDLDLEENIEIDDEGEFLET